MNFQQLLVFLFLYMEKKYYLGKLLLKTTDFSANYGALKCTSLSYLCVFWYNE